MTLIFLICAFLAGALISTQSAINYQLALGLDGNTLAAVFWSFASGTAVLAVAALIHGSLPTVLPLIPQQSPWKLLGGTLGATLVFATVFLVPRIGLANMLIFFIAGQLITSLAIDHYGLLGLAIRHVTPYRVIGAVTVLMGAMLILFGDKLSQLFNLFKN